MVESEGRHHEELLRQENLRLVNKIKQLFFTPKTMNDVAIMDPTGLMQLIASTEHTQEEELLVVRYLPERIQGFEFVPENFEFPTYHFKRESKMYTETSDDRIYETQYGTLPGEFLDASNRDIIVEQSYLVNLQGDGLRQISFLNLSIHDEQQAPDHLTLQRRSQLPQIALDFPIGAIYSESIALNKGDQDYIGTTLQEYEAGVFNLRKYYRQSKI
jgi:hypothetical protein